MVTTTGMGVCFGVGIGVVESLGMIGIGDGLSVGFVVPTPSNASLTSKLVPPTLVNVTSH